MSGSQRTLAGVKNTYIPGAPADWTALGATPPPDNPQDALDDLAHAASHAGASGWETLFDINFAGLPAETFPADGFYLVDGVNFAKVGTGNESASLAIVPGYGLVFQPSGDVSPVTFLAPLAPLLVTKASGERWSNGYRILFYMSENNSVAGQVEARVGNFPTPLGSALLVVGWTAGGGATVDLVSTSAQGTVASELGIATPGAIPGGPNDAWLYQVDDMLSLDASVGVGPALLDPSDDELVTPFLSTVPAVLFTPAGEVSFGDPSTGGGLSFGNTFASIGAAANGDVGTVIGIARMIVQYKP